MNGVLVEYYTQNFCPSGGKDLPRFLLKEKKNKEMA